MASKQLKKSKKLQPTKPLTVHAISSSGGTGGGTGGGK
jgi:hypothetical protein